MKTLRISIVLAFMILSCGCSISEDESGEKTYSLDPNTATTIESTVEGAAGILQILTPLLGGTAAVAVPSILSAVAVWRKLKPRFLEAQNKAEISGTVSASLVDAIELLKKQYPDDWQKLKPLIMSTLQDAGIDTVILENVIRGLRGKQPKTI